MNYFISILGRPRFEHEIIESRQSALYRLSYRDLLVSLLINIYNFLTNDTYIYTFNNVASRQVPRSEHDTI